MPIRAPDERRPLANDDGALRMKVFAKIGVAGYQPYERLGSWLASDLKPLVHSTILSERFPTAACSTPMASGGRSPSTSPASANHTFLLMGC
jgi:hypothetical protein